MQKRPEKRGGNIIPALCSVLGTLILLAVILSALPLALPRLFGYRAYSVVSGSMEPALPVGSVVYVEPAGISQIRAGDIIAFDDDGTVVTHRVIENRPQESVFITKGDANKSTDINPTPYWKLIGRVRLCVPLLGRLLTLYSAREGKAALAVFAVSGLLFRMVGSRLRARRRSEQEKQQPGR
ncbi:MAG: signal peptidase I [Oscillospiraceae bacterium]|nr:signal peptidase I [Oscillospiraceae bacterium]